jgi:lysozyme
VQDLFDPSILRQKIEGALRDKNQVLIKVFNRKNIDVDEVLEEYLAYAINKKFMPDLRRYVKIPLTQGMIDACLSLMYNIGGGNFGSSTLVKKLNAKDYCGAADQFLRWNKAAGKVLRGLTIRREKERELFLDQ